MKKLIISTDFEAYEFERLLFWFHVDAEIHIEEEDENGQSESIIYYADISNGCYAESLESSDNGQYSDMTAKQIKKVSRSLDINDFKF